MARTNLSTARTEFASALNQICAERGISQESVLESIKTAILAAYRKDFGIKEELEYEVELNQDTGSAKIFEFPKEKKEAKKDITPPGFGRIAAQTAKQVILQKIREAEKTAIIDEYQNKVGQTVNGMILRFDGNDIICDIGRGQGRMISQDQVPSEKYHLNQRLTLYISDIRETMRGKQIFVSRAAKELVIALFKREVPEVNSGAVVIKDIAREPGNRSKVAVISTQGGVDPVGSCVGQKGVRVQAVIDEINGEKIDIIPFSEDPVRFIIAALAPADNLKVEINLKNKHAIVTAPEDQLSLAIGKEGQNVRLAARLTGFKIDIRSNVKQEKVGKVDLSRDKVDLGSKKIEKVEKVEKVKKEKVVKEKKSKTEDKKTLKTVKKDKPKKDVKK